MSNTRLTPVAPREGYRYKTRNGQTVGPMEPCDSQEGYAYGSEKDISEFWTALGYYNVSEAPHPMDLMFGIPHSDAVAPMSTVPPRGGYRYKTRNGQTVGPMIQITKPYNSTYLWRASEHCWMADGYFWERNANSQTISGWDLVAELPLATMSDGRPANWTEARALELIADRMNWNMTLSVVSFADYFVNGEWGKIRKYYEEIAAKLDAPQ